MASRRASKACATLTRFEFLLLGKFLVFLCYDLLEHAVKVLQYVLLLLSQRDAVSLQVFDHGVLRLEVFFWRGLLVALVPESFAELVEDFQVLQDAFLVILPALVVVVVDLGLSCNALVCILSN